METSVSYKTTGAPGNRIFTVQWKNMGFMMATKMISLMFRRFFTNLTVRSNTRFGHVSIPAAAYLDDNQPGAFCENELMISSTLS